MVVIITREMIYSNIPQVLIYASVCIYYVILILYTDYFLFQDGTQIFKRTSQYKSVVLRNGHYEEEE